MNVGRAAAQTGWSPRMLRYVERIGLVVPPRTGAATGRTACARSTSSARSADLLDRFTIELSDVVFAARLRREAALRAAVDAWLAGIELDALEWEQRKHERLLAA